MLGAMKCTFLTTFIYGLFLYLGEVTENLAAEIFKPSGPVHHVKYDYSPIPDLKIIVQ